MRLQHVLKNHLIHLPCYILNIYTRPERIKCRFKMWRSNLVFNVNTSWPLLIVRYYTKWVNTFRTCTVFYLDLRLAYPSTEICPAAVPSRPCTQSNSSYKQVININMYSFGGKTIRTWARSFVIVPLFAAEILQVQVDNWRKISFTNKTYFCPKDLLYMPRILIFKEFYRVLKTEPPLESKGPP